MKEQKVLVVKTVFTDYTFILEKEESTVHEPNEVNTYLQNGFFVKDVIVDKDPNDKWPLLFIVLEKNHENQNYIPLPFI